MSRAPSRMKIQVFCFLALVYCHSVVTRDQCLLYVISSLARFGFCMNSVLITLVCMLRKYAADNFIASCVVLSPYR